MLVINKYLSHWEIILCSLALYLVTCLGESSSGLGQSACLSALSAVHSSEGSAYAKQIVFQESKWKMAFLRKTHQNIRLAAFLFFFVIPLH